MNPYSDGPLLTSSKVTSNFLIVSYYNLNFTAFRVFCIINKCNVPNIRPKGQWRRGAKSESFVS